MYVRPTPNISQELFHAIKPTLGVDCNILMAKINPNICLIENFLTVEECDSIIRHAEERMSPSNVVSEDSEVRSELRTSSGCALYEGDDELVSRINERVANLTLWSPLKTEGLSVLKYRPGDEYTPHHDFFDEQRSSVHLSRGGQRVATVIMYLNDVVGGETDFPRLGIKIYPKKGSLLFFAYPVADFSTDQTLHSGGTPHVGDKYIAVKWFRERPCHPIQE